MRLYETDYVLLNKTNNQMACFADNSTIIYGNYDEALRDKLDCEEIIKTTDLTPELQTKLLAELQ